MSPAGAKNGAAFPIQRHGEKSRQLADKPQKDAGHFSGLILAVTTIHLAPHVVAYQALSYFFLP